MAKKQVSKASGSSHSKTPSISNTTTTTASNTAAAASTTTATKSDSTISSKDSSGNVLVKLVNSYFETAPGRVRLIDAFMAFLVGLGVYQFLVVLVIGTFPFNAFLGGLASTVGQFVLLAGLRIQTNKANASQFPAVTPERAIADFIVGSLFLHFMVFHFIN